MIEYEHDEELEALRDHPALADDDADERLTADEMRDRLFQTDTSATIRADPGEPDDEVGEGRGILRKYRDSV